MEKKCILQLKDITKSYIQESNVITIVNKINLDIRDGEIIGVLGRSGSGKSTLLRIISKLIEPTEGSIFYSDVEEPVISMIFQSFGLIPWLTIFDNIALGLEAKNIDKSIIKSKVINAIRLVGLSGYEEAYPKEMSGGMKQRVGFARALVVDPDILLMDEPFSALDYLTANALKKDLLELWSDRNILSTKSIVIITHSIEEAAQLCDRVVVLSSNPGKIIDDIPITLAHPRDESSQEFHDVMDALYSALTKTNKIVKKTDDENNLYKDYPQQISVVNLFHFMLSIRENTSASSAKIKKLHSGLKLSSEQLIAFVDVLRLLEFVEVHNNDIKLSAVGNNLLDAEEDEQKQIFRDQLVKNVPYIKNICKMLKNSKKSYISKTALLSILEQKFDRDQALKIFNATVSWARYADLFSYDNIREKLGLDQHFLSNK